MGYFTGAIKNHSCAVSNRNFFFFLIFYGRDRPRPSNFFTGVFGRWRNRARFLTFTATPTLDANSHTSGINEH
jgi:hypothetical protein